LAVTAFRASALPGVPDVILDAKAHFRGRAAAKMAVRFFAERFHVAAAKMAVPSAAERFHVRVAAKMAVRCVKGALRGPEADPDGEIRALARIHEPEGDRTVAAIPLVAALRCETEVRRSCSAVTVAIHQRLALDCCARGRGALRASEQGFVQPIDTLLNALACRCE
jgi:hypothetical protein